MFLTPYVFIPSTTLASLRFEKGTKILSNPNFFASMTIGKTPKHRLTSPPKESSPMKQQFDRSAVIWPLATKIPRRMGRSYSGPTFFMSAGAKLIITLPVLKSYPQFFKEVLTLSLLSLTAVSASPTSSNVGIPTETSTSTSTSYALRPKKPMLATLHSIFLYFTHNS